jgi:hypothetical protein
VNACGPRPWTPGKEVRSSILTFWPRGSQRLWRRQNTRTPRCAGRLARNPAFAMTLLGCGFHSELGPSPRQSGSVECPVSSTKAANSPRVTANFPTANGAAILTLCCLSLSERSCHFVSFAGDPIVKLPAGTTTISGHDPSATRKLPSRVLRHGDPRLSTASTSTAWVTADKTCQRQFRPTAHAFRQHSPIAESMAWSIPRLPCGCRL